LMHNFPWFIGAVFIGSVPTSLPFATWRSI
jgi:hypothetical protein